MSAAVRSDREDVGKPSPSSREKDSENLRQHHSQTLRPKVVLNRSNCYAKITVQIVCGASFILETLKLSVVVLVVVV